MGTFDVHYRRIDSLLMQSPQILAGPKSNTWLSRQASSPMVVQSHTTYAVVRCVDTELEQIRRTTDKC